MSQSPNDLHDEAMRLADQALALLRRAADLEQQAGEGSPKGSTSRAVLARSAAWLWLQGDRPAAAIRVARWGLETAPGHIDGQLQDVITAAKAAQEKA